MFETFNVNALYLCDQGVLELYSAGRMSGIVLNVGEGCTHVVPVHEGYCLHHAVKRLPYSGKDISERLRQIMA
jgi:actin-related protein